MTTERDIIIERLEQKLAARDKEITQMQENMREFITQEMDKRLSDTLKLRDSTLDDLGEKFSNRINETLHQSETRIEKLEHRLVELNSTYEGIMKELLDQKSIIHELKSPGPREDPAPKQVMKSKEEKTTERSRPKSEYIIADNYTPAEKRRSQPIIEAKENADEETSSMKEPLREQFKKPPIKKSVKIMEGVEISETLKRGK